MVATQHALIDLPLTEDSARYIAMLERKIVVLTISDLKMRCLLELLTDTQWDDERFTAEDAEIRKIAERTLTNRLGMEPQQARKVVADRFKKYQAQPDISTKRGAVRLADEASDTPVPPAMMPRTSQAVPIGDIPKFDPQKALQGWKQRRHPVSGEELP